MFRASRFFLCFCLLLVAHSVAFASVNEPRGLQQWQQTLSNAKGQTVYFYAWGGSKPVNDYLRWASKQVQQQFGVRLRHVKVADISEAVSRLKAESGGKSAIDMMWINGENFAFLKQNDLLLGKLWSQLPNAKLLATESLPLTSDFGVTIDEYEVPWGVGQFNLIADKAIGANDNLTPQQFLSIAQQYPQQLSYPRPPEFHGSTFLKQLLVGLNKQDNRLYEPVTEEAKAALLPVFWAYLDKLHPLLWQRGKAFPSSSSEQMNLYQQQQLLMTVSFNPNQMAKELAANNIASDSRRVYFSSGAITNSHNLAIPRGAQNVDGAKVVINFLLSPAAQKQKLEGEWGDPTVIAPLLDAKSILPAQQELHSSWQQVIEDAWQQRYGA